MKVIEAVKSGKVPGEAIEDLSELKAGDYVFVEDKKTEFYAALITDIRSSKTRTRTFVCQIFTWPVGKQELFTTDVSKFWYYSDHQILAKLEAPFEKEHTARRKQYMFNQLTHLVLGEKLAKQL